jgi:chromosomal replication initiation ATPase DnaA
MSKQLKKLLIQDVSVLFDIVEEVTGVTQEQIKSRSRQRKITDARMMMSESLRRNCKYYRLHEIGAAICDLNHSSVIHYRKKLNDLYDIDREVRKNFIAIDVRFKQIKDGGMPLIKKIEFAIQERDRLSYDIRKMKKLLNSY